MNLDILEDGFYFIEWMPTKTISVIAIFNDRNEVSYMGDPQSDTIGELVDMIKTGKLKLISKIQLPK